MAETLAVSVESPPELEKLPRGGGGVLNHFVVRINYANFPYPISDLMLKYIYQFSGSQNVCYTLNGTSPQFCPKRIPNL